MIAVHEPSRYEPVAVGEDTYWRLPDGWMVGPVYDGHVFESLVLSDRCPYCPRTAYDHMPAAYRRLFSRPLIDLVLT